MSRNQVREATVDLIAGSLGKYCCDFIKSHNVMSSSIRLF